MYIHRIDNEKNHTHAWRVVIYRKTQLYLKTFTDGVYGGKRKALAEAKAYRDEVLSKHEPFQLKKYCSILKKNNKSGIAGVCKYSQKLSNGELKWYWVATWSPEPRRTKQLKFSINKYGEEVAYKKAVFARKKALAQMEGFFNPAIARYKNAIAKEKWSGKTEQGDKCINGKKTEKKLQCRW